MGDADSLLIARGSVLAIPLGGDKWAVGQIIFPGTNFYLGVALCEFNELPQAGDVVGKDLRLFSWTNDAEVFRGNWKVLGNVDNITDVDLPEYMIYLEGRVVVESFDGKSVRNLDDVSDVGLKFRKIRSPLLVQDAVQAALGHGKWKPAFDEMLH